ncbi:MAG: SDR family oxidoreductase [Chloroflexi bacterium]|nr:SDR family oxidoreductase [Chloroflexota bacterium]
MTERCLMGKVALVTGGYRNLGAVTAEALAAAGANVIVNDLDLESLKPAREQLLSRLAAHGIDAYAVSANLSNSAGVRSCCREALSKWGRVDILVNNAGPFNADPFLELREEVWDTVMGVNLKAVYLTARELAPHMKRNGWGRIVNMCAGSAFVRNHGVYGLAKAGVQIMTESLALELGPEITVNAIAPGQILESLPDIEAYDPTFGDRYRARAPLKKLVSRGEVARAIALLCTPAFDSMTGVTFRFDGGAEIPKF